MRRGQWRRAARAALTRAQDRSASLDDQVGGALARAASLEMLGSRVHRKHWLDYVEARDAYCDSHGISRSEFASLTCRVQSRIDDETRKRQNDLSRTLMQRLRSKRRRPDWAKDKKKKKKAARSDSDDDDFMEAFPQPDDEAAAAACLPPMVDQSILVSMAFPVVDPRFNSEYECVCGDISSVLGCGSANCKYGINQFS